MKKKMSKKDIEVVEEVLEQFIELYDFDSSSWSDLDEHMYRLAWLKDPEIITECEILLLKQVKGNPRCPHEHKNTECFVPVILEAVYVILTNYHNVRSLDSKHRYVLEYYLSLSHCETILY